MKLIRQYPTMRQNSSSGKCVLKSKLKSIHPKETNCRYDDESFRLKSFP
jgi:hypothetical protein